MSYELLIGDCRTRLAELASGSVQTCITSPPYFGLRDYGHDGQIGLEQTPAAFVAELVAVFKEVHRVLADDGTLWLNLGDSYAGGGGFSPGSPSNVARREKGNHTDGAFGFRVRAQDAQPTGKPAGISTPGLKPKDLIGIPWRVAFALQDAGWYLRQDIIWHKPNPMPESVTDRCTKAHEYLFLLSKKPKYLFDAVAIQEVAIGGQHPSAMQFGREGLSGAHVLPGQSAAQHRPRVNEADRKELRTDTESRHRSSIEGGQSLQAEPDGFRNKRSIWTVATQPYAGAHFATYPPALILPCVLATSRPGDTVLDPFNGAGTTGLVALENGRRYVGIELNPEYAALTRRRLARVQLDMFRSTPNPLAT